MEGLYHLLQTPDPVIVTTVEAWGQRGLPRDVFADAVTYVVAGETIAPDALAERLVALGLPSRPARAGPGRSRDPRRHPRRLPRRLHDGRCASSSSATTIESIRSLDTTLAALARRARGGAAAAAARVRPGLGSGRAPRARSTTRAADVGLARQERRDLVEAVRTGLVLPGMEALLPYLYEPLGTLADFLPANTLVWARAGERARGRDRGRRGQQIEAHAAAAAAEGRFHPEPERARTCRPPSGARRLARPPARRDRGAREPRRRRLCAPSRYATDGLALRAAAGGEGPLAGVAERLHEWEREGARLVLVGGQRVAARAAVRAARAARHRARSRPTRRSRRRSPRRDAAPLALVGELSRGARLPADGLAIVTEAEIFGERAPGPPRRGASGRPTSSRRSPALKPDDYVVHVDHGVGDLPRPPPHAGRGHRGRLPAPRVRRAATASTSRSTASTWCSATSAADGAAPRARQARRHVLGARQGEDQGVAPRDGARAARSLRRARGARAPAVRASRRALPASSWRASRSRRRRTSSARSTRCSPTCSAGKPMDRLVCGDVGFGKTEVAMRAAFLAVLGGKQVAVLVPTTILAQQHLETFRQRFAGLPGHDRDAVALPHRRPRTRRRSRGSQSGRVDIVIGTHRLLQKDVDFKRARPPRRRRGAPLRREATRSASAQLRPTVDVLTLTATPIPRTLNMSLSGIRDLSVIETPPVDRLAIRTYVTTLRRGRDPRRHPARARPRRAGVLRAQPRREHRRGWRAASRELVPEAKIAVAHGQMHERELEQAMLGFMHGETNVLVSLGDHRVGPRHPERQHDDRQPRRHLRPGAALPAPRARRPLAPPRLRLPADSRASTSSRPTRRSGCACCRSSTTWAAASGSPRTTSRSAAPATCSASSSRATSRRVGLELYTHMLEQAVRELRGEAAEPEVEPEIQLGIPAYVPEHVRARREPAAGALQAARRHPRRARPRRDPRRAGRPLRPDSAARRHAHAPHGAPPLAEGPARRARAAARRRRACSSSMPSTPVDASDAARARPADRRAGCGSVSGDALAGAHRRRPTTTASSRSCVALLQKLASRMIRRPRHASRCAAAWRPCLRRCCSPCARRAPRS